MRWKRSNVQLFSLSSRLPATVDLSLEDFFRHGGLTGPHKDGWGIACFEGPANFLDSDGDLLIADGHRRTQTRGAIEPPGLWTLQRNCPATGEGFHAERMSVSPEGQRVLLLASVPLAN